jgi:hypothetical protein
MPSLRIVLFKSFRNWILQKLRRAANIKIFHGIKNFLFTCFFALATVPAYDEKFLFFLQDICESRINIIYLFMTILEKAGCITTTSARQKATIVYPGVSQQLTLPKYFKLTLYEEGEIELRCKRTFLHICRV